MTTILLTGATGFLGSHILRTVLAETDFSVLVLKRSFSDVWRIRNELLSDRVKAYDVDQVDLENIDTRGVYAIIHCATESGRKENSCLQVLETNLMFPIKLLELAVKNGIELFINTDSYFNKDNLSYSYLLNYSLSKKSLNLWLKYFSKKVKIINMVLEHIYGEYDNSNKFIEKMIQQIAIEKVGKVDLTPGDQIRDFVYVKDVCDAYISAILYAKENQFRFRQFDIGTGKKTSIKNFVTVIKEISRSPTILNFGSIKYREDEIMCSVADPMELSALVGNKRFMTIIEGIQQIINCYNK